MKHFFLLWQAEQTKTRRLTNRVYAVMILIGVLYVVALVIDGLSYPPALSSSQLEMAFPLTFQGILMQFFGVAPNAFVGNLIAIVFAALITYSEYQHDTWKMILPRRRRRLDFILIKALRCGWVFLVIIFGGGLLIQLLAMLVSAVLHYPVSAAVPTQITDLNVLLATPDTYFSHAVEIGALTSYMFGLIVLALVAWLKMLLWGVVALLFTIGLRSAVMAIIAAFIVSQGTVIFSLPFAQSFAHWVPSIDLEYAMSMLSAGTGKFGDRPILANPPPIMLAMIVGIMGIVALIGLTAIIFRRQEIAGQA